MNGGETIVFQDSRPGQPYRGPALRGLVSAVARLNRAVGEGKVKFVPLSGRVRAVEQDLPAIITAAPGESGAEDPPEGVPLLFSVSYYVGSYSTVVDGKPVNIVIQPRWGPEWLAYWLQYVTGIYLPPDADARQAAESDSAEWLLILLWASLLAQALRRFHLAREYRTVPVNERYFRGRLDVTRHIRDNLVDQSRFACVHRPLTLDTAINQAIRYVLRLVERRGYAGLVRGLHGHGERLAGLGVKRPARLTAERLDEIRYTRMTEGYRPLMRASQALIRQLGSDPRGTRDEAGPSFFVDLSELWENYLLAILRARLPGEYRVFSPNETGGEYLIAGKRRGIRPDLIIEKDGRAVAILDAKFKWYTQIGSIGREDLYQMTTYLHHYGGGERPILGLFVCPCEGNSEVCTFTNHETHRIGLVNFGIVRGDLTATGNDARPPPFDLTEARELEAEFADMVRSALESRQPGCQPTKRRTSATLTSRV